MKLDKYKANKDCEDAFEWMKWMVEIPFISFPAGYEVKMVPPFANAVVRFFVRKKGTEKHISVYLDCYNMLGCCNGPYWEAYPVGDDTYRCDIYEVDKLVGVIVKELEEDK